jgi:N-acetylmuramic acid 6-phosphate etherase
VVSEKPFGDYSVENILKTMSEQSLLVVQAVKQNLAQIKRLVELAISALRAGGRMFYVGAGTSGRLAVLDAVELGPTFGVFDDQVVPLIAGGTDSLWRAVEGSEDDTDASIQELKRKKFSPGDVLIAISASGTTPYTLSALSFAQKMGAVTGLVTCNENRDKTTATVIIALPVGEEIVKGSTRLNAGTAQKIVLNMISTATMVGLGKTLGPYMTQVSGQNQKLKMRRMEIIKEVLGLDRCEAEQLLHEADGEVDVAILAHKHRITFKEARARLALVSGNLNLALLKGDRERKK